jgi:pyruvate dehydrogenase E2 component (dihydrolipoamide acetyltransferase)
MATIIEMPKLSDTMTVGTLVTWLKKEGDTVAPGEMLAEVETDKATMELENFEEGVLLKQYAKEGDEVAVGGPVCAVGKQGEQAPDVGGASPKPAKAKPEEPPSEKEKAEAKPVAEDRQAPEPPAEAPKEEALDKAGDGKPAPAPSPAASSENGRVKPAHSPARWPRKRASTCRQCRETGPGGRIVREDVLKAAERPARPAAAATSAARPRLPPPLPRLRANARHGTRLRHRRRGQGDQGLQHARHHRPPACWSPRTRSPFLF